MIVLIYNLKKRKVCHDMTMIIHNKVQLFSPGPPWIYFPFKCKIERLRHRTSFPTTHPGFYLAPKSGGFGLFMATAVAWPALISIYSIYVFSKYEGYILYPSIFWKYMLSNFTVYGWSPKFRRNSYKKIRKLRSITIHTLYRIVRLTDTEVNASNCNIKGLKN